MSRDQIVRRFEQWLDGALADEEPPRGIEAEILASMAGGNSGQPPGAAYSLWSAMTALTQEVKLQGRSFKELTDAVGSEATRIGDRERDQLRETERRETERRTRKEILGVLIDLRDRLARGLESVRASEADMLKPARLGWRERIFARPAGGAAGLAPGPLKNALAALKKGYELGLERLDQTLREYDAREIPCAGLAFDPRRMNAIDREPSSEVPEGTVIEVYRSGYEWNGEVFRTAQVKVACAPVGKENE